MNKRTRKLELLKDTPDCPCCGCRMVADDPTPKGRSTISHAVVLSDGKVMCFQCHNIRIKKRELNKLPLFKRWSRKTGLLPLFRRIRKLINQFVYFKIRGGSPTGRIPSWLNK